MEKILTTLMPIIQQVLIGHVAGRSSVSRFTSIGMVLRLWSSILLLAGLFLIIYAEFLWLGIYLSPVLASLATALSVITLGLLLWMIAQTKDKKQTTSSSSSPLDFTKTITDVFETMDEDLKGSIRDNPKLAVLMAVLGGFVLGKDMTKF